MFKAIAYSKIHKICLFFLTHIQIVLIKEFQMYSSFPGLYRKYFNQISP